MYFDILRFSYFFLITCAVKLPEYGATSSPAKMANNECILSNECMTFSTMTWHINAQAEPQLCERVCSAFTGTSQAAPHALPCLSTFHFLMLGVPYSHPAQTQVPGSQLSPCLSSHRHCTLPQPFPCSPQQEINLRCTGGTSDTGLVKKTKQKPSLPLASLIY